MQTVRLFFPRFFLLLPFLFPFAAVSQSTPFFQAMNRPIDPFKIAGNVYYVGASGVASFLVTTTGGHILIDGGFDETVPLIEKNLQALGFKLEDIKILLCHHAHIDHAGGLAALKKKTGAILVASEADAILLANGGKNDFHFGDTIPFPPVKADRIVKDMEEVQLGDTVLTTHLTPGHTKGCLTWTMQVRENDKEYDLVFVGSVSAPGYRLVDNPKYLAIADDYARSFAILKSLPCDIFVSYHGGFFQMDEKLQRRKENPAVNPFVDPQGYRQAIEQAENTILDALHAQ